MNKNTLFYFIVLLSGVSGYCQVQKDTIWYDYLDQKTLKENATGYRFITPTSDRKFEVASYNLENNLLSKGNAVSDDPNSIKYDGLVTYYQEGGTEMIVLNVENGIPTGKVISKLLDGTEYIGEFKEGNFYDGILVNEYLDCYNKLEMKDGQFLKATLFSKKNDSYKQIVTFKNNTISLEEIFDANDNLIASLTYNHFTPVEGVKYTFNHNPLSVLSIEVYKDSIQTESTSFYSNGNIKTKTKTNGAFKDYTYFDLKGKIIGEFRNDSDYNYNSPTNIETEIEFNYLNGKQDQISKITTYKNNLISLIEDYNDDGILDRTTTHREDGFSISKIEYWNPDGSLKATIEYAEDGYTPWEGTLFVYNTTSKYVSGKLIEETTSYSNKKPFEIKKDLKSTYFDLKGTPIGTLTYTQEEGYWMPFNGTSYYIVDDLITNETTYEKGYLKYSKIYTTFKGKQVLYTESFYENGELIKEVIYHTNGAVFKEETYTMYEKLSSKYFDQSGKEIGAFDHKNQNGTLLTFFNNDVLESITKYNNGVKLYEKKYIQDYLDFPLNSLEEPNIYLQSEIDFLKEGKFYNKGELVSTVIYVNGQPSDGIVYEMNDDSIIVSIYKNGLKEGDEVIYAKYNPSIITKRVIYNEGSKVLEEDFKNGIMTSRVPYSNEEYHGEAIYYNEHGQELSRLQYIHGEHFEGTHVTDQYTSFLTQTYKEGVQISLTDVSKDGLLLFQKTKEDSPSNIYSINVFDELDGNLLYSYQKFEDAYLHGVVSYYEHGALKRQAVFNNGVFESGSITMQFNNYNPAEPNEASHYTLTKKNNKIYYQLFTETNDLLVEYEIKETKNNAIVFPIFPPFTPDQLYPQNHRNTSWAY